MSRLKAAVIQVCSGLVVSENLAVIERLLMAHQQEQIDIFVLPECFAMLGGPQAEVALQADEIREWMASTAKTLAAWFIGGAVPIRDSCDGRHHASCLVYNPEGKEVACYQKMHLFDAEVSDGKGRYRESDDFIPGAGPELVDIGQAKVGLSICYDLRFPELYRYLVAQGATVFTVPSAFTKVTGEAHWEVLLRARAIESQCYVLAANQAGTHADGRQTYGRSMIISPWGDILAEAPAEGAGVIIAELDLAELVRVRQQMPCLKYVLKN
ncbi:carbon-nitrogen hydrolase family protein [Endozoicomonas sp. SCSIO W0465]|uniref:carbon-nitrogen hydrolase family protein n=1 Tax=Endozoicomonas sp. SCSIO W0465 TaxID=2918516 RepID=UPI002076660D|nr:carbon-nitrogen hydrolase family protein [Endozoicomonas sp. SCSIO W0465]USE36480.1 carbon-nitrogen hydrolase family protein [Endozoicomonas sp. SCSIO W0465]